MKERLIKGEVVKSRAEKERRLEGEVRIRVCKRRGKEQQTT